ncbi:MAG: SDR family NAD(P)-dependent oxidoreductase [Promethearchaeota archaeon]
MKEKYLKGKVAVITGACGGIARELVKLLDNLSVNLVISDIDDIGLQNLKAELKQDALAIKCDITNLEEIKHLFNKSVEKYGKIEYLINTVGIIIPSLFENANYDDILKQININLIGTIQCTKEIIPYLKNSDGGQIITISSLAGIVPETYSSIYTATKFALRGLNLTLNLELRKNNIYITTIFPDSVDTPMLKYEAEHGGSPLTFLDGPLPPIKVAKAIIKTMIKKKPEICVPKGTGRISKFIMCFPKLVLKIWPKLEKKGEIKKQEYIQKLKQVK